jgi:hypothetical protein
VDIATGRPESHPTPLPLDESQSPGVAPPTAIVPGQLHGPTYDARDTTGEYQAQMSALEGDCRAAQATGQGARGAMLAHYSQAILPVGAAYGDAMALPPVPANAVPSEGSDLYPYSGMEPTPAGTGFFHPTPLPE